MAHQRHSDQAIVNEYAAYLRNVADADYISARTLWWARMNEQFLWSSVRATEKYLQCIFLFSFNNTRRFGHVPWTLACEIRNTLGIDFEFTTIESKFIQRLENYGTDRYRIDPNVVLYKDLAVLDLAIWNIRRYCQSCTDLGSLVSHVTNFSFRAKPHTFRIHGGFLEKVLDNQIEGYEVTRERLIWQNPQYGAKSRKKVRSGTMLIVFNPRHLGDAHRISVLRKYVKGL
jgi:hypothetical protein